jgi:hypothetical protein
MVVAMLTSSLSLNNCSLSSFLFMASLFLRNCQILVTLVFIETAISCLVDQMLKEFPDILVSIKQVAILGHVLPSLA